MTPQPGHNAPPAVDLTSTRITSLFTSTDSTLTSATAGNSNASSWTNTLFTGQKCRRQHDSARRFSGNLAKAGKKINNHAA